MADTRGDMLERVAMAICEAIPFGVDQVDAAKAARAAIEALREPTEGMTRAGYDALVADWPRDWNKGGRTPEAYSAEALWPAMIDAILKEEGNG